MPQLATMECDLYSSAFSGEVVFSVETTDGEKYEGIAPKHYASPKTFEKNPTKGTIRVRLLRNGGNEAFVATPDGEELSVPTNSVIPCK